MRTVLVPTMVAAVLPEKTLSRVVDAEARGCGGRL